MRTINLRLKKKLNEIYSVEPNNLGLVYLNNLYKKITAYFKTAPFIIIVPLSIVAGVIIYWFFGYLLIGLVNLLQYGF